MFGDENIIEIVGRVYTLPVLSHSYMGENFYKFYIETDRTSGASDILPIMFSEQVFNENEIDIDETIKVVGKIRTYNYFSEHENRRKLHVFVLATEIDYSNEPHKNDVALTGTLCRKPVFRKTPKMKRITELMIASNTSRMKSSYIPCICWNATAWFSSNFSVGDRLKGVGRFQSREYTKANEIGECEMFITYEVSLRYVEKIEEKEEIEENEVAEIEVQS